jgi:hypothetical protein
MASMQSRYQFSTLGLLKATVWVAIACFAFRAVFIVLSLRLEHVARLAAALLLVIAPFAAAGAMFDRMGTGILWGFGVVLAVALLAFGGR